MADITLASVLANSGQTFREAALAQAFLQISENLKYMRHTSMLRGDDTSYMLKGNGEFIPYDPDGSAQDPGSILARTLTTYHAELLQEFDPENIYKTIFDKPLSASKITMLFHNQDGGITHPIGFLSGAWRMEASKVLSTLLAVAVLLFLVTTSI